MTGLLISAILLSLFGLFNMFGIRQSLASNQIVFVVLAFVVYGIARKIGRDFFNINSNFFYWLFVVILLVTYVIGLEVKGSKRWIDLYFFNFQASEFFKVFFILHLANFLSQKQNKIDDLKTFLKSILYFVFPILIVFKQPDLGNALVFGFTYVVVLAFSRLSKKYILYLMIILLMLLPLSWFALKGYQRERVISFFNPHVNSQGTAYNMMQSIITIGSGQFLGRGLGLGTQSRLYFLPENHTDFAFASLVEQFGFVGGIAVIILCLSLVVQALNKLLKKTGDEFLYILGFTAYIFFQIFVNIGMNLGVLPVAGIALPFISYGGSSIAAFMLGLAIMPK